LAIYLFEMVIYKIRKFLLIIKMNNNKSNFIE
jgi:hypothetical protein